MYIWGHEVQHGLSAVISPKKKRKLLNKPYSKGKKDEQASIHMHVYSYLSITTLPFPAYNGLKVLLSADTASIHIYSGLTSAKGSPSYTLLVMDTYSRASTWLRGLCLHCSQQAHTPYLLAAVKKQREKRRWCTGSLLLTVSHTKDKNTERNQTTPAERGAHRSSTVPTTTATVELVLRPSSPINRPSDRTKEVKASGNATPPQPLYRLPEGHKELLESLYHSRPRQTKHVI